MAKSGYIATIQILLPDKDVNGVAIDSHAAACDAVISIFSERLVEEGVIVDWSYLKIGGQFLSPQERLYNDPYEEGEAFS